MVPSDPDLISRSSVGQLDALAHAKQAKAVRAGRRVEALAVVSDAHVYSGVRLVNFNDGAFRPPMLGGIGECLLDEPVDGGLEFGGMTGGRGAVPLGC